tara:strand:- start:15161 stop:16225 length:1065 start_codon:yes stop_codon:yes gene_type:complete
MEEKKYRVIGVMSGTSLDGIDLVLVEFKYGLNWSFKIHHAETIAYKKKREDLLKNLVSFTSKELHKIDQDYTSYLAKIISSFIKKYSIKNLDAICSHGHTALHQPEKGITYQIGNLPLLAKLLNHKIVCNFRVQDVELGGQGAPLVPIGDKLLFAEYHFCLNLGGFANVSTQINNERIAYDICPANIVLNHYVKKLGFNYDDKGKMASTGTINQKLLNTLNALPFYNKGYPKSLGLEWVDNTIFPLIDSFQIKIEDILKTFVEHIAIQLASEINKKSNVSVLITGGGVYNTYLIERLQDKTENNIVIPDASLIEFKEAVIFGFLGVLKLRNENNCLKSVTGSLKDHSSGEIYLP